MMVAIMQDITAELTDNWPAFVYMALTLGFSVCYFRERRAERAVISARFDKLESLVKRATASSPSDTA
jgi:hypothetical protein